MENNKNTNKISRFYKQIGFIIFFILIINIAAGYLQNARVGLNNVFVDGGTQTAGLSIIPVKDSVVELQKQTEAYLETVGEIIPGVDRPPFQVSNGDFNSPTKTYIGNGGDELWYYPSSGKYKLYLGSDDEAVPVEGGGLNVIKEDINRNYNEGNYNPISVYDDAILRQVRNPFTTNKPSSEDLDFNNATKNISTTTNPSIIPGVDRPPYAVSSGFGKPTIVNLGDGNELWYYPSSEKYSFYDGNRDEAYSVRGSELDKIKSDINKRYYKMYCDPMDPSCAGGVITLSTPEKKPESNRCSTTYVTIDKKTGKDQVFECYGDKNDRAIKAIDTLARCVASNTSTARGSGAVLDITRIYKKVLPQLEAGMCKGPEAQKVESVSGQYALLNKDPKIIYKIKTPDIPTECERQYKDVIGLMGGLNGNSSARAISTSAKPADLGTCAWKGSVVCSEDPIAEIFTCKRKSEIAVEKIEGKAPLVSLRPKVRTITGCAGAGGVAKIGECLSEVIAPPASVSRPTPPQAPKTAPFDWGRLFGGGSDKKKDPKKQDKCAGLFNIIFGKFTGCKKNKPTGPPAKCEIISDKKVINAGDTVRIKWRTANASSVSIDGIDGSVPNSGESEENPSVTTKYVLKVAQGGNKNAKVCEVIVDVDGSVVPGATGKYPPRISCDLPSIQQGDKSKVVWECPSIADKSRGIGINTNGDISGSFSVSPQQNTNYSVECIRKEEVIGANTCSVKVGTPTYDIITYPEQVGKGERVRVSWASLFMKSCRIRGPRGFDYTQSQGVVVTEPFSENLADNTIKTAIYTLECDTQYGKKVVKEVEVKLLK